MQSEYNSKDKILIPEISTQPLTIASIHEGGFGRVLEVHTYSGEKFALKILKWELGLNRDELISEAEKLANLSDHPNIAEVFGLYNLHENPCIVMRYYPKTLADEMGNKLKFPHIIELINQICLGLEYLHYEANIIHLDLKPQNVLVDEKGVALLSDFGISAAFPKPDQDGNVKDLFMSGIVGTITYMSPEQLTTQRVSSKTDIFSLGVILYEMLTGRHPFYSATFEQTAQNILTVIPTFKSIERIKTPTVLRDICLACLEKNPENRPTASDIIRSISDELPNKSLSYKSQQIDSARLINKASTLFSVGRIDEAQSILEECYWSQPYNLSAAINLAQVYYCSRNIPKAIEISEIALSIVKWYPTNQDSLVTLLTNLSDYYLSVDPEKAIYYARWAIELDAYDWQAFGNIGEACRVLGGAGRNVQILNDGLEACLKGMELNPDDLKLKVTYGGILLDLRDLETLSPYIVELINTYGGDDINLRFLLIRSLIATGQLDDAENWLGPMRKHNELVSMVAIADREIKRRRNR
jgi:serine/threonine protein kinase